MALRAALKRSTLGAPLRYKSWVKMIQDKVKTADDAAAVSGLAAVCDYYGQHVSKDELQAKNNFEINWEEWGHLVTPNLVSQLKEKVEAINKEEYDTTVLSNQAVEETEELKSLKHLTTWVSTLNMTYLAEQDDIIENISHAKPFDDLDLWEFRSMYKYENCPSRWDAELGWHMPNNDQIWDDYYTTNIFQFQKDMGKIALQRYYFDWVGRHQVMSTVGKLSQTEREE